MDRSEIKNYFLTLPAETQREYETQIVDFALSDNSSEFHLALNELLQDESEEDKIRFAAFCTLCEAHRRNKDYSKEKQLIDENENLFNNHPLFTHIKLLYYIDNFDFTITERILVLAESNTNLEVFSNNSSVYHMLADLIVTAFENNEFFGKEPQADSWLQKGLTAVDRAILLQSDYAKFYCTKGRLLTLRKDYDEAAKLIRKAVDLEDSKKSDYPLRINEYLNHLQRIQIQRQNDRIEKNLNDYMKRIEEQQTELKQQTDDAVNKLQDSIFKNLEFIGLFAGIISFTIGSINISDSLAEHSFPGAAGLIIVLMGALLCVFAGFGIMLHGKNAEDRNVIVFLLGLAVIVIGFCICCRLP